MPARRPARPQGRRRTALTYAVSAAAFPRAVNTATVTSDAGRTRRTTPRPTPSRCLPQVDLSVTKTHTASSRRLAATYVVTVANPGPTDDPGPVTVPERCPRRCSRSARPATAGPAPIGRSGRHVPRSSGLGDGARRASCGGRRGVPAAYPSSTNTVTVTRRRRTPTWPTTPRPTRAAAALPTWRSASRVVRRTATARAVDDPGRQRRPERRRRAVHGHRRARRRPGLPQGRRAGWTCASQGGG